MASRDWIVPFPAGYTLRGRSCVGLIPCHGCDEWPVVRLDKRGHPYASCDAFSTTNPCGRRYDFVEGDVAVPREKQEARNRLAELPDLTLTARQMLATAWGVDPQFFDGVERVDHQTGQAQIDIEEAISGRARPAEKPAPAEPRAADPAGDIGQRKPTETLAPAGNPVAATPSPEPVERTPQQPDHADPDDGGLIGAYCGG